MRNRIFCLLTAAWLGLAPAAAQDALSPNLQMLLMGVGGHVNDWGTRTNANLSIIESALTGISNIAVNGNMTLSIAQTSAAILNFTGALTSNVVITVPFVSRFWIINNNTTGAFTLSLQASALAPLAIPRASIQTPVIFTDGANIFNASATYGTFLPLSGGAMTGAITNLPAPVSASDAATKAYVDAAIATVTALANAAQTTANQAAPSLLLGFFDTTTCPAGWQLADGTHSPMPDMRGYFVRGLDTSGTVDPTARTVGSTELSAFQTHVHQFTSVTVGGTNLFTSGGGIFALNNQSVANNNTTAPTTGSTSSETRPINVALLPCQKI